MAERTAVKDVVESLGVPHTEVDLILVNGASVGFEYRVRTGDRVTVYPVFEALDVSGVTHLRPEPLREPRFVVDGHLGRLAAYLRLLGFDTLYDRDAEDPWLARTSRQERRILLTRDRGLLKRSEVTHGLLVRENLPRAQLLEVVHRLDLAGKAAPFTRCMACNGALARVAKEAVLERLPPDVARSREEFHACASCGRVFWAGTHAERLGPLVGAALAGSMRAVSDLEAIRAAVVRVLHHVDLKEWDALPDLFTDEVETDYTSLFGGEVQRQPAAALVDGWRGVLSPVVTQHLLGPVDAEVDGDQAVARCHVRGYHVCERAPGGPEWMVAGHYTFRLRRGGAGWRIHHLTLATLYQTGNRQLLREANS